MIGYLNTLKNGIQLLSGGVYSQVRDEWLGQWIPPKPIVIQFPINDICNAKCVMCNIGLRKKDREINVQELKQVLQDPLFSEIRYVGISGGEPTLRPDLPEIGKVLIEVLPKLQGVGIITNALREQMVTERILGLSEIVKGKNLSFGVNVSLDGIGTIHDRNRGVEGNFTAAVRVIQKLKSEGVTVSIGCTLTPITCYDADDVLAWCISNNIQDFEFRIAVDIKRVYNEGYSEKWPFSSEQLFHLIMFFDKLSTLPEVDPAHKDFYRSLVSQLAFNAPRAAGCDWKSRGVTLDSRGNISYCSVQSPILGSALEKSAFKIFKSNLFERNRIIKEKCDGCKHDLLGSPPPKSLVKMGISTIVDPWRNKLSHTFASTNSREYKAPAKMFPANKQNPADWKNILITGWYGTETAGDKAILAELVHFLKKRSPDCQITVTTMDRKVTAQTLKELPELEAIKLIEIKSATQPAFIRNFDAVIIGGGPLEEISETELIYKIFEEANQQQKSRIVFGCGVGPLYTNRLKQLVGAICKMATGGFVRDEESKKLACELSQVSFPVACDPALSYFRRWHCENANRFDRSEKKQIVTLFRANTNEYFPSLSSEQLKILNQERARQLAQVLEEFEDQSSFVVNLLPMHSLDIGGDDRIFNRKVQESFTKPVPATVEKKYLTLPQLMEAIASADTALAMRYHGHLMCFAFGIPTLSIDYTGNKGKVQSLSRRIGLEEFTEDWSDFNAARVSEKTKRLIKEGEEISTFLRKQVDVLLKELEKVYSTDLRIPQI
jgi:polysaccharide pyruvyl transferase WcaK-like protein/MoaA/NifB/PqqE/SkfB family radical SAM enzyme